ncbi:MAG: AAA family ATPase [Microbacterium sp.]|uniref:ATP-binding protein n=1 Tax=Microbacterium sp. TaxID=51671 RepID=UPI001AC9AE03|nr:AAA family ATPase [Microbacterium sp.]MBN9177603.1 AAA family ATPase [Microbacterium sp.]
MRLTYFGGPAWDAGALPARGRGQEALLLRLALDAGTVVSYRALAEDIWAGDAPEDPRAALQSLASRLRKALPGAIEAASGGYRLALTRADVDLTAFQDLAAHARRAGDVDAARAALALWRGDPWLAEGFDWVLRDLLEDRAHVQRVADAASVLDAAQRDSPVPPSAPDPRGARPVLSATTSHLDDPTAASAVPAALTSLVGRATELDQITAQLRASRLVTILGPGGAGKTTLALETARRAPDVLFVELAPAAPGEIWPALASAVGRGIRRSDTPARAIETDRDRVIEGLSGRAVLIVLDNCEHVSAAAAAVARDLLAALPLARLLATSREPLGLPAEAFVALGPLPELAARELFTRRVEAARGASPQPDELEAAARIVRRLDGLPLALELAAARARSLTIAEIDAGLDDRFALLAHGPRAADPRHQTLRALIDWSWETLTNPERAALLAASVFPDGIGAKDAADVARTFATDAATFDLLVDRSLLRRADGRFRMLETVREYGLDRLRADGGEYEARTRAAEVLATLAAAQDARLRGPEVREALAWFDANDESLGAAARLAQSDPELRDLALRLLRANLWAWGMRERFAELRDGIGAIGRDDAALDSEAAVVVQGLALMFGAFATVTAGVEPSAADAARFSARAAEIAEAASAHPSELSLAVAPLITSAARAYGTPGPRGAASWLIDEPAPSAAPPWTIAILAVLRAASAQNAGDIETLGTESERALALFRDIGDVWGLALASQMRSEWLQLQGRLDEALDVADFSSERLVGLTSVWDVIQQRALAIGILARLGRFDEAHARVDEIRRTAEAEGSDRAVFQYRFTAASVALIAGDGAETLRHLDALPPGVGLNGPQDQLVASSAAKRAQALLLLDRPSAARVSLRGTLPIAVRTGDQPIIAEFVQAIAALLARDGHTDAARRAFAASVRIRGRADETDPAYVRLRGALGAPEAGEQGDEDPMVFAALLED